MTKKRKKPRRKVALPTDRHGTPIDVGDIVAWDDDEGTCIRVDTLTFLGDEFADTLGSWIVNIEEEGYDNLAGCEVVWKGKGR